MFQKGRQKTGGRKKGTKPKGKSLRQSLSATGFNLAAELVALYKNCEPRREKDDDGKSHYYTGNSKLQFDILKLIAKYTQPPPPKEEDEDDDEDGSDDQAAIIRLLRESLNEADAETEGDSVAGGDPSLETPQGPAVDLQADPKASEGST